MTEPAPGRERPDPTRIVTRRQFGAELTVARLASGLSVRRLARGVGVPASTLGGYFAGTHLPALQPADLLPKLLQAMGVHPDDIALWWEAYWRVRGSSDPKSETPSSLEPLVVAPAAVSTRPPLDRLFVEPRLRGREEIMAVLDEVIIRAPHRHGGQRIHVLQGLGGCGKSMIALAAVQRAAAAGMRTFWISAGDPPSTLTGMQALALELGAGQDRLRGGSLPDTAWQLLRELDEPWLLVFDNADDPLRCLALPHQRITDGNGWLRPDPGLGTVIVTTRDGQPSTWGDPPPRWLSLHRISGLDRRHGAQLILELAGNGPGDESTAGDLAERLGGLPLALMLAGRYFREAQDMPQLMSAEGTPSTFAEYAEALQRGAHALTAMDHIWQTSLALLEDRGLEHAPRLLSLLSCLGQSPIPFGLLLHSETLRASPLFTGAGAHEIWTTIRGLAGLGLITMANAHDTPVLRLHPLVRDHARHGGELRTRFDDYLRLTTALLAPTVRDAHPKSPHSWARWRLLADHCTGPLVLIEAYRPQAASARAAVGLAGQASSYLRAAGHLDQAERAFEQALRTAEATIGSTDPVTLEIAHDFARLRYDQGRLENARQRYAKVLELRRQILGTRDPQTLMTQYYLARTLRAMGRLDQAAQLLDPTYSLRVELLGEDHPDTLTSRHGLADLLRDRGQARPALEIYHEVLAARSRVLGDRHPATLVSRQYAAEMNHALDNLEAAEEQLRQVWLLNQEVRGADHPRTLASGHALVNLLHDRGNLSEAQMLATVILGSRKRLLGDLHPATLASQHQLGLIMLDAGEEAGAYRAIHAVLWGRQRTLGTDHPATQASRRAVDALQRRLGLRITAPLRDVPLPPE